MTDTSKPTLALSTCWNSFRHTDGYAMIEEIRSLGFTHVELSHGIRILLVPGILKAVEEGLVKISSTHNFCPLPTGITQAAPNLFEPSDLREREQEQWLRHTKRTIDFSSQVKARVIVMHLGSVHFWWLNPANRLSAFVRRNPTADVPDDKRYQKLLRKCCEKLRKRMPPYWQQLKDGIEDIREYALNKGVNIGFENREKFEELPVDADYADFLASLPQPNTFGYWHDTGHAAIKESMGLLNHRQHLESNASRLLGFHLHDVSVKGKDHQPVGSGKINFEMISEFWRPEHLLTLELSPRTHPEEVLSSKVYVEALLERRFGA